MLQLGAASWKGGLSRPGHGAQNIFPEWAHKTSISMLCALRMQGAINCIGLSTGKDMYYVSWLLES